MWHSLTPLHRWANKQLLVDLATPLATAVGALSHFDVADRERQEFVPYDGIVKLLKHLRVPAGYLAEIERALIVQYGTNWRCLGNRPNRCSG